MVWKRQQNEISVLIATCYRCMFPTRKYNGFHTGLYLPKKSSESRVVVFPRSFLVQLLKKLIYSANNLISPPPSLAVAPIRYVQHGRRRMATLFHPPIDVVDGGGKYLGDRTYVRRFYRHMQQPTIWLPHFLP